MKCPLDCGSRNSSSLIIIKLKVKSQLRIICFTLCIKVRWVCSELPGLIKFNKTMLNRVNEVDGWDNEKDWANATEAARGAVGFDSEPPPSVCGHLGFHVLLVESSAHVNHLQPLVSERQRHAVAGKPEELDERSQNGSREVISNCEGCHKRHYTWRHTHMK